MGPGNDDEGQEPDNGTEATTTTESGETTTAAENETDAGNETDVGDVSGEIGENIPENIQVVRHNIFENNEWVGVTGLLENTGDRAFEELEVQVHLQDNDTTVGEYVDTKEQEAGSLAPGANWQFVVIFPDEELRKATDYTIEIDGELAEDGLGVGNETDNGTLNGTGNETVVDIPQGEINAIADNLQVVQQNIFQSGNQVGVAGTIKNTGDRAFEEVEVEVTLQDGDTIIGEFVDTNEKETETLDPGSTWQFVVFFPDEELNQATDYTIEVDGELA